MISFTEFENTGIYIVTHVEYTGIIHYGAIEKLALSLVLVICMY